MKECVTLKLTYNNTITFLSLHSVSRDLLRAYYVLGFRDTVVTIPALLELMVLVGP